MLPVTPLLAPAVRLNKPSVAQGGLVKDLSIEDVGGQIHEDTVPERCPKPSTQCALAL